MKLSERIRRFFGPAAAPEHPLTEEERDEERYPSTFDVRASALEHSVGDSFDEDEHESPR